MAKRAITRPMIDEATRVEGFLVHGELLFLVLESHVNLGARPLVIRVTCPFLLPCGLANIPLLGFAPILDSSRCVAPPIEAAFAFKDRILTGFATWVFRFFRRLGSWFDAASWVRELWILADKLSKLNSTQQCIETLSHWCIFHRSKAELVVATWDKQFHNSEMVQKVPLLYLANDILQNSKRKGNEFVNEFWKVLPAALKDVVEKGDDQGKNVVSRLVVIWEERRVFGSRAQNLKDLMLGEGILPPLELNRKRSRSVRIVKRDSRSIRTKLSIGSTAEKIVSAIHLVLSEHPNEDVEMSNCKSAVHHVRKMEKDVDIACATAKDPKRRTLAKELENEENTLKQCIEKLKSVETSRVLLVSHLKEALHEQESQLENVRTQMQVAQAQAEEAESMRKRLMDEDYVFKSPTSATQGLDINAKGGQTPKRTAAAIAAEVADKLTASSSSQLIMSSVLSTFAAEEAKSAGHTKSSIKSEKTTPVSDASAFMPSQLHTALSSQFVISPQQYLQQPSGAMMPSYGYVNFPTMSAGPTPPPHVLSAMVPLSQQSLPMAQKQSMALPQQPAPLTPQQPMPLSQQPPIPPSFRPLQPPGMLTGSVQYKQPIWPLVLPVKQAKLLGALDLFIFSPTSHWSGHGEHVDCCAVAGGMCI
ncbi:hypothetical protein NL676_013985 [Syzygium grande]|nr:hypothetical protein NL676_013985 [Syzygium grande]